MMQKFVIQLFNQRTFEVIDDCVDGEVFDSEEETQNRIDEIYSSMSEGEEVLRLSGEWEERDPADNYGYGSDDLILIVEEYDG